MGFRDCISEVSQHLLEIEGFHAQNPFRLRLLSHLKCFAEQKSIEMRASQSNIQNEQIHWLNGRFKIDSQYFKKYFDFKI